MLRKSSVQLHSSINFMGRLDLDNIDHVFTKALVLGSDNIVAISSLFFVAAAARLLVREEPV